MLNNARTSSNVHFLLNTYGRCSRFDFSILFYFGNRSQAWQTPSIPSFLPSLVAGRPSYWATRLWRRVRFEDIFLAGGWKSSPSPTSVLILWALAPLFRFARLSQLSHKRSFRHNRLFEASPFLGRRILVLGSNGGDYILSVNFAA